MKSLTAADRNTLIRLASQMSPGTPDRRALLSALKTAVRGRDAWWDSFLERAAKQCVFHFRNKASADLWEEECAGQISDGMWENSSNTGWIFWANIPSVVDGTTKITGPMPEVRRSFNFTSQDLLDAVGDQMLKTVQKSEPAATMGEVIRYLKEIKGAMKGSEYNSPAIAPTTTTPAATPGATSGLPEESEQKVSRLKMLKACADAAGITSIIQPADITFEAFLFAPSGSRAGQFHYFVYLRDGSVCSAYGKFGKVPKGVLLGKTYNASEAKKMISAKAKSKISSGYDISTLAGVKHMLNPVTTTVTTQS